MFMCKCSVNPHRQSEFHRRILGKYPFGLFCHFHRANTNSSGVFGPIVCICKVTTFKLYPFQKFSGEKCNP